MRAYRIKKEKIEIEVNGATLLSVDEAKNVPREILERGTWWWWLRSPGNHLNSAAYVSDDGAVDFNGIDVNYNLNCVRPVFILGYHNLQIGDKIEIYGINATVISESYALVDKSIGRHCFDFNSNNYEISGVKEFVDYWFEELKKNES